ncbi:hypothetical protein U8607_20070 [Methylobacterium durans]|uniref:hypothetical protein n=1 Tax=Methylobacterium durans TaxID=2202825 RepID=UPI002AFF8DC9|nr:hypothetical protein [Methylobacterium durans]MEA1834393.1 hypothetical protein [Methylobacterium durans]
MLSSARGSGTGEFPTDPFLPSERIGLCHKLSFGSAITRPEDLKYWTQALERHNGNFSLLLEEMGRSRRFDAAEIFCAMFYDVNIDILARTRPAALVVSLFIHASGRFPPVDAVIDILLLCSLQDVRMTEVIDTVAKRSGAVPRQLKRAIRPYLLSGSGPLDRIKLHLANFNLPIRRADAMADLASLRLFMRNASLSHDVAQLQSTLLHMSTAIPAILPQKPV